MEQKTKTNQRLMAIVSEFERELEKGSLTYLKEKTYHELIEFYDTQKDVDKAIEVVDLAIDQHQYRSKFFIIKSKMLLRLGDINQALDLLDRAEVIAPFEIEIRVLRAKALAMLGNTHESSQILSQLKNLNSEKDQVEVLLCESYLYEYLKECDLMKNVLKQALTLDPKNEEALERMLVCVELGRSYQESIEFHKVLIDENPYNYLAWYNLGHSYGSIGEYEEAIICLEYSYLVNAKFESGYLDCADYAYQIQDYSKAFDCYEDVMKHFGEDSEYLILAAECQLKLGQTKGAKFNLYKALKQDPYNEELYFHLANCYVNEKSWYTAINAYHKALSIDDNREEFFLGLAKAYVEIENFEKSDHYFKQATLNGIEESVYWKEYTLFLVKNKKFDEATEVLDTAEEYTFGADLIYCRAAINLIQGDEKNGYELLEEALLEDFSQHQILFDLQPEFQVDPLICGMINYYKPETKI